MVSKTEPNWRLCAEPKHSKSYAFPRFWQSFLVLGFRKIETLQQATLKRAEDTFKLRLGEPRRFQSSQNGGSGLPKQLARLSPKATMDTGGTAFGRLGEKSI